MSYDPQNSPTKSSFFSKVRGAFSGGGAESRAEKSRMEAFLAAVPAQYCGFAPDGSLAYSPGFCTLLDRESIKDICDIQSALDTSDATVLEGLFARLKESGEGFSTSVRNADHRKHLKLSGTQGQSGTQSGDHTEILNILWIEDITPQQKLQQKLEAQLNEEKEDHARLQCALDQIPLPLWIRDSAADIRWCNKSYAQALDASPASVIAEQSEWSFKPAKKSATKLSGKLLAQKALKDSMPQIAHSYTILSGKRRLMKISELVLPAFHMTLGLAQDQTHEEELEQAHKRDHAAYQELLGQLGTAVAIYNAEEKLEFYNAAFARLWDLQDSYLNTRPKLGDIMEKLREMRRLPEQADFRAFKKEWLNMFTRLIGPHEDMLYLPDNSALRMLVVPHPMGGVMMMFEDVTSHLELESSYNTLVAVQQETLDNLAEGVAVFGSDGRLKLWNPAFARLWKLQPETLNSEPHITRLVDQLKGHFSKDDWDISREKLLKQGLQRKTREGHMFLKKEIMIAYATMPLPDGGVLVTHIDVTDTLRVENALREKNTALKAAEQLKTDFIANVSYQLRTPLSSIMGFTEILENEYFGALNDKQKEYTTGMHEAGNKLLQLINNILDLSTIEAGYMDLEKENVEIYDLLEGLQEITTDWARKGEIEIKIACAKNMGTAFLDQRRIKQILLSLINNAIAHTPEKGTITLSAKKDKNTLQLCVRDTGCGIPKAAQKRIFKPFERLSSSEDSGAGLGLTLVKNIVEMHGGKVTLESVEGKGTAVILTLPLSAPPIQKTKKNA